LTELPERVFRPDATSSFRSTLDTCPNSVLFSTEALGWREVNVHRRVRPEGGVTEFPAGMHEHVVFVWHGPTHVSSLLGGMRGEVNASAGLTQFVPAQTPVAWERRSPFHFTKVALSRERIDVLMVDLFDRDPAANPLTPRAIHDDQVLRARAQALVSHAFSNDPANQLVVDEVAEQLGVHLIATYGGMAFKGGGEQRLSAAQLRRVVDYIDANLNEMITLDDLAGLAFVSKYHFLRRFKLSMGMTPHQFITQRRIGRAKELILTRQHPFVEIAQMLGFSDQSHFTRVFKAEVGVTPRVFQRGG
jgi:AraC family transcriptional regulator